VNAELRDNQDMREFFRILDESGPRRSFKNLKTYKRRKRWF
jgi:hypothetical protein